MARSKRMPWDKWSWDAWRGDPRLGAASLAARGLWMEMLGIMREGSPVGYMKVGSKVILQGDLARLTRSLPEECAAAFSELEGLEVFSRDDETGCIFSRRMVRDEELRQKRAAGGRLGGNPALLKKPKDKPKVILEDKPKVTLKSSEEREKKDKTPTGSLADGEALPVKLNPQALKVKRLEDFHTENGAKPPRPQILAVWLKALGGDVDQALEFLADMERRGKLGKMEYCGKVVADWSPNGRAPAAKRRVGTDSVTRARREAEAAAARIADGVPDW